MRNNLGELDRSETEIRWLRWIPAILAVTLCSIGSPGLAASSGDGSVVVRIDDPSGTHCIDSTTEQITVYLRRAFVEKKIGIFTEDNKAGVLVRTSLAATDTTNTAEVKVPAVDMISVKDDGSGRVSLALEYAVASNLALTQGTTITQSMDVLVNIAKTKGKNTFGQVIDIAGQVLGQSLLPSNPYTAGASKFLKFANQTIDASIASDNDDEIAHIGLKFNKGTETDIKKCESAGNERTGALAVLRSVGKSGAPLIPITDTEKQYCFSYSSQNTYELTAAHRKADASCPAATEFAGVNNDYVMMLLSASPTKQLGVVDPSMLKESLSRCKSLHLAKSACGVK